jgi:Mrp family chromosome partitioning ATPase
MAESRSEVVAFHSDAPEDGVFPLPLLHAPDSKLASSYRVLCHRIVEENDPAVLAITSPGRSEGKTTCAVNLAIAFAEYRRSPVLLIDANFRTPALGVALGFAPPACFGEQLDRRRQNGAAPQPWQLCAAFHDNLHVLAVDPARAAQSRLDAPTFRTAIEELRASRYERIVIDCTHVLDSADVHVVQDAADALLLTAWAGKTTARNLNLAAERLAPANVLGVALVR